MDKKIDHLYLLLDTYLMLGSTGLDFYFERAMAVKAQIDELESVDDNTIIFELKLVG